MRLPSRQTLGTAFEAAAGGVLIGVEIGVLAMAALWVAAHAAGLGDTYLTAELAIAGLAALVPAVLWTPRFYRRLADAAQARPETD